MNAELVRAVFDCGTDDLRLLDDSEADMFSVIQEMRDDGTELTMNNIIEEVFKTAQRYLVEAYREKVSTLEVATKGIVTEGDYEMLNSLKQINPETAFDWHINLQDTEFYIRTTRRDIYESYLEDEIAECERIAGYGITWLEVVEVYED